MKSMRVAARLVCGLLGKVGGGANAECRYG